MKNTTDIIRSLDICVGEDCRGCCYDFLTSENKSCVNGMINDACTALTAMRDRCARYAEEIMVLQERLKEAGEHG